MEDGDLPLKGFYDVEGVPHHLIDFLEPTEIYSAGQFARDSAALLNHFQNTHPQRSSPLVVGGTGLYLKALVDGMAALPSRDDDIRARLMEKAEREGRKSLHRDLEHVDPESAKKIPATNIARLIRALEVYELTGAPLSQAKRITITRPIPLSGLASDGQKRPFEKFWMSAAAA